MTRIETRSKDRNSTQISLRVPFNRPTIARNQLQRIDEALRSGTTAGNGPVTKAVEQRLETLHQDATTLLTPSCTAALEMTALLMKLQPGDEVIVPSFTFVSTANAYSMFGATVRFADIRPDTWTIQLSHVEKLINPKTRAVVVVHYGGTAPDVAELAKLCQENRILLIEDNAHGLFGAIQGRPLGTFGAFSTLSFHETKNVSSGEGGALVINDSRYIQDAEIIREKGTDRSNFLRGQVDKYTWVSLGSSYLMNEISAASLGAQLDDSGDIQLRRRVFWNRYSNELACWRSSLGIEMHDPGESNPFHLFALMFRSNSQRDRFLAYCRERNVMAVFHYVPLDSSPMGSKNGEADSCPVTDHVSQCMARLPLFSDMKDNEADYVIDVVASFTG
jgi:dTDP-4-amino-4,6-dideoxygalactose transaminase